MDLLQAGITAAGYIKRGIQLIRNERGKLRDANGDQHIVSRVTAAIAEALEKTLAGHRGRYDLALTSVERKYAYNLAEKAARLFVAAYHNGTLDHDSLVDLGGYLDLLIDLRKRGDA